VWGPAAPVRKGEDEISFNLITVKLGGALTGEGEDSGGARQNPTWGRDLRWPGATVQARKQWGGR
jgi:hypothetical protein